MAEDAARELPNLYADRALRSSSRRPRQARSRRLDREDLEEAMKLADARWQQLSAQEAD